MSWPPMNTWAWLPVRIMVAVWPAWAAPREMAAGPGISTRPPLSTLLWWTRVVAVMGVVAGPVVDARVIASDGADLTAEVLA